MLTTLKSSTGRLTALQIKSCLILFHHSLFSQCFSISLYTKVLIPAWTAALSLLSSTQFNIHMVSASCHPSLALLATLTVFTLQPEHQSLFADLIKPFLLLYNLTHLQYTYSFHPTQKYHRTFPLLIFLTQIPL